LCFEGYKNNKNRTGKKNSTVSTKGFLNLVIFIRQK
jgi:hypothetical protein